jgi:hypothetical protein
MAEYSAERHPIWQLATDIRFAAIVRVPACRAPLKTRGKTTEFAAEP